ncbi:hypothetical protein IWX49DRAFT_112275 [Phyllosticta citricarpa]
MPNLQSFNHLQSIFALISLVYPIFCHPVLCKYFWKPDQIMSGLISASHFTQPCYPDPCMVQQAPPLGPVPAPFHGHPPSLVAFQSRHARLPCPACGPRHGLRTY